LLEALPDDADRQRLELDVLVVYGKALMATLGHAAEATGDVFARARILCDKLGDPPQLLTVLFVQWTQAVFRVRLTEAEARAAELLARATQRDDALWLVMGYYTSGFTSLLSGHIDRAIGLLREGIARFDPARRHEYAGPTIGDPRVVMRVYLGWGLTMCGAFSAAERELAAAVEEARELRQPWLLSLTLTHQVNGLLMLRGPEPARPRIEEAACVSAGVDYYTAVTHVLRGWLLAASGDAAGGLLEAREGRGQQQATGAQLHIPFFFRMEADMLLGMGHVAEAVESLDNGKRIQTDTGEHWDDGEFCRQRGETLAAMGDLAAAEAEFAAAQQIGQERGQHLFVLRAAVLWAGLLSARGEPGTARTMLMAARSKVENDPSVLDVAAADRLLARLSSGL